MSALLDALSEARAALLSADTDGCAAAIERFEGLCAAQAPDAAVLDACRAQLAALHGMATAATAGVAAARIGLADALAAAGRLTTYDCAGARETRMTRSTLVGRY